MKTNEAPKSKFVYPDKLYARTNDNITLDISYAPQTLEAIEYTRTDAFIEKACEWLRKSLDNGLWVANDVGKTEKEAIIEHFKEAIMFMKVEKTCDFCKHLTWEDIKLIWTIGDEIPYMPEEDFFKELLRRYKAQKGE